MHISTYMLVLINLQFMIRWENCSHEPVNHNQRNCIINLIRKGWFYEQLTKQELNFVRNPNVMPYYPVYNHIALLIELFGFDDFLKQKRLEFHVISIKILIIENHSYLLFRFDLGYVYLRL